MAEGIGEVAQVAVIGAGYAGMAAAVELATRNIPVTVFEASRVLGGRARAVETHGVTLDNGIHIMVGAYHETLRLMRQVGADPARLLLRLPLTLAYPGELLLAAPRLPAPLHMLCALLGTSGLNWSEKFAAIRFMRAIQRNNFRLSTDCTMVALLEAHRQPQRLRAYLWEPLCVAALNTPADAASAQIYLNVLRDSLAAARQASDLLLPRVDLGALFPDTAASYLAAHGGAIQRGTTIERISKEGKTYVLHSKQNRHGPFSQVIVAVAPYHLPALVKNLPELNALRESVASLRFEPIVTCYLSYPSQVRLPQAMVGHAHGITQWLFDRGRLGGPSGLLAAVISARGRHLELSNQALAERIHAEIAGVLPNLPMPLWTQVITERRATFSCTPNLQRPETITPLPGLLLAGDYVAAEYPATLETAVRSGIRAAASIGQATVD
ncbi:MAG: hydroxysqualene dehydroxylase HpnE [Sterolibacterium sp.]|nr:hydroxysqualene dehydroxylase HpnE [Sterolibacterium sp.]